MVSSTKLMLWNIYRQLDICSPAIKWWSRFHGASPLAFSTRTSFTMGQLTPKYNSPWRYLNPKGIHPGANFNPKSESPGWEFTMSHITPPPKLPMQKGGEGGAEAYHIPLLSRPLSSSPVHFIIWSWEVCYYSLSFDHGKLVITLCHLITGSLFVMTHHDVGFCRVYHGPTSETPIEALSPINLSTLLWTLS